MRTTASEAALVGAFFVSCFFYGIGFNLIFLLGVVLIPVGLWWVMGPQRFCEVLSKRPWFGYTCVATLFLIVLNHLFFSISVDTSFAPSWIAACLPLFALVCVCYRPQRIFTAAACLVFVFASISAIEFLAFDTRAHAPLFEPNNYVTLLYLAWLPWLIQRLGRAVESSGVVFSCLVTFTVCIAMFATHSRFAVAVAVGAAVLLLCLLVRKGLSKLHVGACVGAIAAALLVYWVMVPGVDAGTAAAQQAVPQSTAQQARWLMIEAAWQAMLQYGGAGGIGLYNFALLYPMFRSPLEQETAGQFVHNDYVQLALEGGVWFVLPVAVMALYTAAYCLQQTFTKAPLTHRFAYLVAVGVALCHALVNFVFYILPLVVMLGLLLAAAFAVPECKQSHERSGNRTGLGLYIMLGLGLVTNMGYLALDVMTYGVFAERSVVPFTQQIRQAEGGMLQYARLAQRLNPQRGVPVLGEARLLEASAGDSPSDELLAEIDNSYQRAVLTDPWNPSAFLAYYRFLAAHESARPGAAVRRQFLLQQARALDPLDLDAFSLDVDRAVAAGDLAAARAEVVSLLQWCEALHRLRSREFAPLLQRLATSRLVRQDQQFALATKVSECAEVRTSLDGDGRQATFLMRFLRDGGS